MHTWQDKSTLVRKRVLKLLRDIAVQKAPEVDLIDICARLLARTDDDELTVQEEASHALRDVLLAPLPGVLPWPNADGPGPASSSTRPFAELSADTRAQLSARVDILAGLGSQPDAADAFVRFVQKVGPAVVGATKGFGAAKGGQGRPRAAKGGQGRARAAKGGQGRPRAAKGGRGRARLGPGCG